MIEYDEMVKTEKESTRPVNCKKKKEHLGNQTLDRRRKNLNKKKCFRKIGFYVPIKLPNTLGGLLAKMIGRQEAENRATE